MSNNETPPASDASAPLGAPGGKISPPDVPPLSAYLVRAMRHELVQPLHSVNLMVDLAPVGGSQAELTEWAARIDRALDGMKRMLGGLSEACRFELDEPSAVLAEQSLGPILTALAEQHRDQASRAGLAIGTAVQPLSAATDRALLKLGLERLIDNAIRHSQGGTVTLELKRSGGLIRLIVRDDGAGLDPADLARCLAPLGTGSVARIKGTAGLGMGLTIAQQVARALGYGFVFESEPGRGTSAGYIIAPANA